MHHILVYSSIMRLLFFLLLPVALCSVESDLQQLTSASSPLSSRYHSSLHNSPPFTSVSSPNYKFQFIHPVLNLDLFTGISNVVSSPTYIILETQSSIDLLLDYLSDTPLPMIIIHSFHHSNGSNVYLTAGKPLRFNHDCLFIPVVPKQLHQVTNSIWINSNNSVSLVFNYDDLGGVSVGSLQGEGSNIQSTKSHFYLKSDLILNLNTSGSFVYDFEFILNGESELNLALLFNGLTPNFTSNFSPIRHDFWVYFGPIPIPITMDLSLRLEGLVNSSVGLLAENFSYGVNFSTFWDHNFGISYHDSVFDTVNNGSFKIDFDHHLNSFNQLFNLNSFSFSPKLKLKSTFPSLNNVPLPTMGVSSELQLNTQKSTECDLHERFLTVDCGVLTDFDIQNYNFYCIVPLINQTVDDCEFCNECLNQEENSFPFYLTLSICAFGFVFGGVFGFFAIRKRKIEQKREELSGDYYLVGI
ncbi:hypothetical protein P9112_008165 [Eukaryota sp. TZLM1-RC]